MNRLTYTIKGFTLLAIRLVKYRGKCMPYHSKKVTTIMECVTLDKKYQHNGVLNTAIGILKGECRLHWLRG